MSKGSVRGVLTKVLVAIAACMATGAGASALSDAAASMVAGEWKKFPAVFEPSIHSFFHHPLNSANDVMQFGNTGVWDPIHRKIFYLGAGHSPEGGADAKFLQYEEANNLWTATSALPSFTADTGHGYDHNVIDPTRGVFFSAQYLSRTVARYDPATGNWTKLPDLPTVGITKGMTFFPEMDALIVVDPVNKRINTWREGASAWTVLRSDIYQSNYHFIAEYDHVRKVVYFGGGNKTPNAFYELDRNGAVRQLASPPLNLDLGSSGGDNVTDPVSGRLIIRLHVTGQMAEYVPEADRWNIIVTNVPADVVGSRSTIAIPISTYGVIMYVVYKGSSNASTWLYKHKQGTLPPLDRAPPAAPAGITFK